MSFEIGYTLVVCVVVIALLLAERLPGELTVLLGLGALVAGGVLSTEQALAGFANPAAITIAGMFVLSAAIQSTGGIEVLGHYLQRWSNHPRTLMLVTLPPVVVLSAFLNNTPVVVILVPLMVRSARRLGIAPSRLLMPVSFAAILGGSCTLIGTSGNLLVSQILAERGQSPLGMFEIGLVGFPLALAGLVYLLGVAPRLLPDRAALFSEVSVPSREFLSEVLIREGSSLVGQRLASSAVAGIHGVTVLEVNRGGEILIEPINSVTLEVGDRMVITAPPAQLQGVAELNGKEYGQAGLGVELVTLREGHVVEGVVAPNSSLLGRRVADLGLRQRYGVTVLAAHRHGVDLAGRLADLRLAFGDILLLLGTRESCERLRRTGEFVVLDDAEAPGKRRPRLRVSAGILAAVVLVAASGLAPVGGAVLVGCLAMVLSGCLDPSEAYRSIEWNIILLVVGMLGIGAAVEQSGAAELLSRQVIGSLADLGPVAILSGTYLFCALVTAFLSNTATAVLITPIALTAAADFGVNPHAMAVTVAIGASAAFATPVGYQTNLFVYGVGGYRFVDFVRVGLPLTLLGWVIVTLLVPWIWPVTL